MRLAKTAIGLAAGALMLAATVGTVAAAGGGTGGNLEGSTWVLNRYSANGTTTTVPAGVYADAVFAAGTVHGSGGCNNFTGPYTANGASLTFGQLASTMMACPPAQTAVETAYFANLAAAATYTATADSLVIYNAAGDAILVFQVQAPGSLTAQPWDLVGYNNGKQAVVSVITGTAPTAVFGSDGTVSGNATCNQYNGPYTTSGDTIKIGPLASTMMACADPAQQDQETAFLAALQKATTYAIRGGTLELRDASGALQADFAAATAPVPTAEAPSAEPATGGTGSTDATTTPPPTSTSPGTSQAVVPAAGLVLLVISGIGAVLLLAGRRRTASL